MKYLTEVAEILGSVLNDFFDASELTRVIDYS